MISLILTLALLGFVLYVITNFIPMAQPFKLLIYALAACGVVLFLMQRLGLTDLPVPHLR